MPLNLPLPDWVPWWAQLVLLVLAILFGVAILMMPFAVFGLKGRLDFLGAQLDDIHAELRMVAMRLPDQERPLRREPAVEQLSSRPVSQRQPSPPRTADQVAPEPRPDMSYPPRPGTQGAARPATDAPRTTDDPQRWPPPQQRRPVRAEDWTPMRAEPDMPAPARMDHDRSASDRPAPDWTAPDWPAPDWDDRLPRRPLRTSATGTPRGNPPRDPERSEPVLRWPPR